MTLEELIPLLRATNLHDNPLSTAMLDVDGERLDIASLKVGDFFKYLKREVIGISTWLPFTIFLKDILDMRRGKDNG